ncbi:MAG: hypothetical protein JXX28_10955 [Deltaproteobacteria bacterium]|nr:hypothetical protein [Deltaproteobacteria bacterium]
MNRALVLLPLALTACKAPVEAPTEISELSAYMFQYFDNEDADELFAAELVLEDYLAGLDLTASVNDRAVSLTPLVGESVEGITIPEGVDPNLQIPVAVSGISRHGIDAQVGLILDENQICVASDSVKYAARTFLSDAGCFGDGTCDTLSTMNEVRRETFVAKVWYDTPGDFRRLTLDDGRQVILGRSWLERQFIGDSGDTSWDQSYALDVFIEDPAASGQTLRFYAMWSSVTIPGLGDDAYAGLVKSGVDEYYENADNMVDGEVCGNDRDRENDRPAE